MDKIKEVYEKYKYLDELLSDEEWNKDNEGNTKLTSQIRFDLWQAIKKTVEGKGGD